MAPTFRLPVTGGKRSSAVKTWKEQIVPEHPCWHGYRDLLDRLPDGSFPAPSLLNSLLPADLVSAGGAPIRFVPAAEIPGVEYERHIGATGEVSTREGSWHDLFNAMVWARLPLLKSAMNALHCRHLDEAQAGRRGKVRDALTLLDECGVIVACRNAGVLTALLARDWHTAFITCRDSWRSDIQVLVCGHAIHEKFQDPYKTKTAHAVNLHVSEAMTPAAMDDQLASVLREGQRLQAPRDLSPLPLMGIPGWWTGGEQDEAFYADPSVFRPPRPSA